VALGNSNSNQDKKLFPNQLDNQLDNCSEVKVRDTDLTFTICVESTGIRLKHKDKEVLIDFADFENPRALRSVLDEEFNYDIKDPLNGKIAFYLNNDANVNQLLHKAKYGESYEVCLEFVNGECSGVYITADKNGVFITKKVYNKTTDQFDSISKQISSVRVKKIQNVRFNGIFDVDFGAKFVKIETDSEILTGEVDELTALIKARYGLEQPEKFKFLLNQDYETVKGYYAIGAWFDGDTLNFATESLYNPSWKKIEKYKLPPDIPAEKKREVLERILGTVNSFKDKNVVTWILSFGVIANFAHFLRQKVGYFPHAIIVGKQKTGKTTLTVLNQYLYWGSNPLPPIKPKTEPQLRQLLSQSTLLTPLEEWSELASNSEQVAEMLNSLHSSAQRFVLKRITTSNPDVNGTFLSLSSILADTNFTQEIDTASLDKIIFVKLDKDEGIDISKAQANNALLKNELKGNYHLHNILHSIGIELIQVTAEKLKQFNFNKERAELLNELIFIGYTSWIDIFKKYGITLTPAVDKLYIEFPSPELKMVEAISDEDLNLLFEEFINSKIKQIEKEERNIPTDITGLTHYGFYFDGNEIVCNYGLISEFSKWLSNTKGLKQRPVRMLISDLGFKKTTARVNGQLVNIYKLNSVLPLE
jgi:hypothetical protein